MLQVLRYDTVVIYYVLEAFYDQVQQGETEGENQDVGVCGGGVSSRPWACPKAAYDQRFRISGGSAASMKEVREFNASFKDAAELRIEVASNALMYTNENRRQNYGYRFLQAVYDRLGIEKFISGREKSGRSRIWRKTEEIFRFLVFLRIL